MVNPHGQREQNRVQSVREREGKGKGAAAAAASASQHKNLEVGRNESRRRCDKRKREHEFRPAYGGTVPAQRPKESRAGENKQQAKGGAGGTKMQTIEKQDLDTPYSMKESHTKKCVCSSVKSTRKQTRPSPTKPQAAYPTRGGAWTSQILVSSGFPALAKMMPGSCLVSFIVFKLSFASRHPEVVFHTAYSYLSVPVFSRECVHSVYAVDSLRPL